MFTGIIKEVGEIIAKSVSTVTVRMDTAEVKAGDSVAINGVCLTAREVRKTAAVFDVSEKTFKLTNLGESQFVNIELPLRAADYISGHFVSGHIDGLVKLSKIENMGEFKKLFFAFDEEFAIFIALRGSVSLDGISLTVESLPRTDVFAVNVIPETISRTNLAKRKKGDMINFEVDVLARYIVNSQDKSKNSEGITKEKLLKWL